ncbi:phage adaptor protein [Bauldia sp.]|uniref:phage adaptor protein n=1 Tax=Bauldia sp. TaxID=2575872 RepID=UPI003BAD17E7
MALSTYSDLKAAIADWAARAGLLADVTPDFVTLTEGLFNHGDEELGFAPLRCRQMETAANLAVTAGAVALPSDFLEVRRVTAATSPVRELSYAEPGWLKEAYPAGQNADAPKFYTIEGDTLRSVANVELVYYRTVPALSDASPTNWLLTTFPNAYLFGGLLHYALYQMNDEATARYLRLLRGAVRGLTRSDMTARAGVFEKRTAAGAY